MLIREKIDGHGENFNEELEHIFKKIQSEMKSSMTEIKENIRKNEQKAK